LDYVGRFTEGSAERVRALSDANWGLMRGWIHLIASASYPFPQVLDALSQPMFVFPVEGLPGERYFPGTHVMDEVESRAEELLQQLFDANDYHATIQPHSGTQANQIVYNAVLRPADTVLSVSPREGGHISHTVLIGRRNRVVHYRLAEDGSIDIEGLDDLARNTSPRLIIAGGSAMPREIDFESISHIAKKHRAFLLSDISHTATFVAAGLHGRVTPHADFVTFNMVKNLRGPAGGVLLYRKEHHRIVKRALFPDTQGGPNETVLFAKYVALELLNREYLAFYAARVVAHARAMSEVFRCRDLTVVTGGTDSHIVLIDLRSQGKTGFEIEKTCELQRILLNRNLVPNDSEKPDVTSGIRIGTACLAILGYTEADAVALANGIADLVHDQGRDISGLVRTLTTRYNETAMRAP
jgi:glycine hydroxymethyltransferase